MDNVQRYWLFMHWLTLKTRINTRHCYFSFHNGRQHVIHFGFTLTILHIFGRGLAVRLYLGDGSNKFECYPLRFKNTGA